VGRYLSFPVLLVVVILQSTVVPYFRIAGGGPDLILMVVLSWMMLAGLEEGLIWAIVGGILQDLVTGVPTGTTALALVVIAGLENLILGPLGKGNLIFPPLVVVVGTVLYQALLALVLAVLGRLSIVGRGADLGYMLTYVTLPTVTFNVILMLPIFRLVGLLYQATRPRRVSL
jgi:rod shape-determining protein MreD